MLNQLGEVQGAALSALQRVNGEQDLETWRVAYLGRSSPLMQVFDKLGGMAKEERPAIGRRANEIKQALEQAYGEKAEGLRQAAIQRALQTEHLDVTLPGRTTVRGRLHPANQNLRRMYQVFADLGFQVYRSPEVETDEYNFQLLNFPPDHPARDMQDSFYVDTGSANRDNPVLLRTHTSPGQIRAMREYAALDPQNPPPVRIILPGMCFRYEQVTYSHEMQFNQIEGLAVGRGITFADLKGTLSEWARRVFGRGVRSRFRASYFPFTEPSAEMDIECFVCGGVGCNVCKKSGWLEIYGCGMVHPVVLSNGGYDPQRYSGFAFGGGPERAIMLRHRIDDIRYFWANDLRFLEQF
jgi:phenylalanyl-tRNA synthetase alpha chain